MLACTGHLRDVGSSDEVSQPGKPPTEVLDGSGSAARLSRLTQAQYRNTLEQLFGAAVLPTGELPPDNTSEAFTSMGAALVATSNVGAERYHTAALEVADRIWEQRENITWLPPCVPEDVASPCIDSFLRTLGRRLFRRPTNSEEVDTYRSVITAAAAAPEAALLGPEVIDLGLRMAVAAMLESPSFLYVVPRVEPVGPGWRYVSHTLASRISYLIADSAPDEALLAAADADELTVPANLSAHIDRLLDSPDGEDLSTRFFEQSWLIHELPGTERDPEVYPQWNTAVERAAIEEFRLVIADFDRQDRDLRDLFTHPTSFVNGTLAPIYGVDVDGPGFQEVALGSRRSGLLTSVALLAATANSNRTSPTRRGVFLRTRALCLGVVEPDPDVDSNLPTVDESGEPLSTRELVEQHRADPQCAGCHALFDPLGLTLEHFDAVGAYRDFERGFPVDATATFNGVELDGAVELGRFLRNDAEVARCMARQFFRMANGRIVDREEEPALETIQQEFASRGHTFRDLVRTTLLSDAYRTLGERPNDD